MPEMTVNPAAIHLQAVVPGFVVPVFKLRRPLPRYRPYIPIDHLCLIKGQVTNVGPFVSSHIGGYFQSDSLQVCII